MIPRHTARSHRLDVALLAIAGAIAGAAPVAGAETVKVSVDQSRTTGTLAADAVGLSYEMRTVGEGGFDATTGNEAAILTTLGVHNIRIGGNTVDYGTFWQPGGQPVPDWASIIITPADVARVAAFAKRIDAKVAWAVNIQHLDAASLADQVGIVVAAFGDNLHSIQCGNEPNALFASYAEFSAAFAVCKTAVGGRAKISGADTFGTGVGWNAPFAADEAGVLAELNFHYYTGAGTIAALLAPETISAALAAVRGTVAVAAAHNLGYRTDETNSRANGGVLGMSDVYASALWAMHYALASAEIGAATNFHGFMGVCRHPTVNGKNSYYTPICAADEADAAAKIMSAAPEYYGLWMASHLGPGRFHPVTVCGGSNFAAYAVGGVDDVVRIALIEKSAPGGTIPVELTLAADTGSAQVIRMTGPSLAATSDVVIQGAALDRDGRLMPGAPETVAFRGGKLSLVLPTGSAAIVAVAHGSGDGGVPQSCSGADAASHDGADIDTKAATPGCRCDLGQRRASRSEPGLPAVLAIGALTLRARRRAAGRRRRSKEPARAPALTA